jgi:Bacterial toxin 23
MQGKQILQKLLLGILTESVLIEKFPILSIIKKHTRRIVLTPLIVIILLLCKKSSAQQYQKEEYGANIGVVVALGTHFNRVGFVINSYYRNNHFQVNPELRFYFNLKSLGPKNKYFETVASIGIVYGYGKKRIEDTTYFFSTISNQTAYKNSVGYSFNMYFATKNNTQQTGIVSLQFDNFNFITENDLLARPKFDRFRTGAILIQYQKDNYQFGINTTLFTGQMGNKVKDENYPHSHLYKLPKEGKNNNFSHGLLSAYGKVAGNYYQTYQTNIGIDSERVRHAIQNRFAHDILVGNGINAHIPMLDINGDQYLFKEGQEVKPMKFYMNGFMSPALFY